VATSADGDLEPSVPRHLHGIGDVGKTSAARNDCRALVDQAIMDFSGVLIAGVIRPENLAGKSLGKLVDGFGQGSC
jgi:hypothetical protein